MSRINRLKTLLDDKRKCGQNGSSVHNAIKCSSFCPGEYQVAISHVNSALDLFVVSLIEDAVFIEKLHSYLTSLSQQSGVSLADIHLSSLRKVSADQLVLYYDNESCNWIRANVTKVIDCKTVEIFACDSGGVFENVRVTQCINFPKDAPEELKTTPGVARKFALFGVHEKEKFDLNHDLNSFTIGSRNSVALTANVTYVSPSGVGYGSLKVNGISILSKIAENWKFKIGFPCTPHDIVGQRAFPGTIAYAKDPDFIFIHPHFSADIMRLRNILTKINSVTSRDNVNKLQHLEQYETGSFVLAKATDDTFYRAKIIDRVDDVRYNLYYVDYGNMANANVRDICVLPDVLKAIPVMGFPVKLDSILSPEVSGRYPRTIENFCYRLSLSYANCESAFQITLTDNADENGIFPAKIVLVNPRNGDDKNSDLAEAIAANSVELLIDVKDKEVFSESDLRPSLNVPMTYEAIVFDSNAFNNTFSAVLRENLFMALEETKNISLSLRYQLIPYKSAYNPGDLVLFNPPASEGNDGILYRGKVISFDEETSYVTVKGLEVLKTFLLHLRQVIPYLKDFKAPTRTLFSCVCSHKIPVHDCLNDDYIALLDFDKNEQKEIDGAKYYQVERLRES